MKINYFLTGMASASALLMLPGCIDDNYDLSDIDTTTELKVNDLVVPLNLKSITLDNVIDIDENDPDATIKYLTVGDQKYFAIEKSGDFHANPSTIKEVVASSPSGIDPIRQTVSGTPYQGAPSAASLKKAPGTAMKYVINEDETRFTYDINDVDEAIQSVKNVHMDNNRLLIDITLSSADIVNTAESVEFKDLVLTLPKGMKATCAAGTIKDNLLTVPSLTGKGNSATLRIVADYVDFTAQYGAKGIEVKNKEFDYTSELGVLKGDLIVYPKNSADLLSDINFTIDYDLSGFTATRFSGMIDYATSVDDIDAVNLDDLPDFLAGPETNLIMSNPQLTLTVNNPAGDYQLECVSGLTIKSIKDNMEVASQSLPGDMKIGYDKKTGPYTLVLAPRPQDALNIPEAGNRSNYEFAGLSYILAGEGLPERLDVELASSDLPAPHIKGDAVDFPLGSSLESVDGTYTFLTLLALDNGSRIVYEKTDDGWNDEDLDALAVSSFSVSATATTDLPCGVVLKARPVGLDGKDIVLMNPEEAQAEISAYAKDEPFTITMVGDIRHLDGIHFIATAESFDGKPLTPQQDIKLDNLKVRVTGTYTKEL